MKTSILSSAIVLATMSVANVALAQTDMAGVIKKLQEHDDRVYQAFYTGIKAAKEPIVLSCNKNGGGEIEVELDFLYGKTPQKIRAVISRSGDAPARVLINQVDTTNRFPKIKDIEVTYARLGDKDAASDLDEKKLREAISRESWHSLVIRSDLPAYYSHQIVTKMPKPKDTSNPGGGMIILGGTHSHASGFSHGFSAALPKFWKGVRERCDQGTQQLGPANAASTSNSSSSAVSVAR